MLALNYVLLAVSAVGFIAVAAVHIAALCGFSAPFQQLERIFVPTLFVVCIPTIFFMNRLARDFKQKDVWKAALRGCPKGMRVTLWTIAGYSWLVALSPMLLHGGSDSQLSAARSVSGVILAFYAIAVGVLYSATRAEKVDIGRRCLNGHRVGPLAKFCEECGAPVVAEAANPGQPT